MRCRSLRRFARVRTPVRGVEGQAEVGRLAPDLPITHLKQADEVPRLAVWVSDSARDAELITGTGQVDDGPGHPQRARDELVIGAGDFPDFGPVPRLLSSRVLLKDEASVGSTPETLARLRKLEHVIVMDEVVLAVEVILGDGARKLTDEPDCPWT